MIKIIRDDIYLISRYSNWSERGVEQALKEHVYNEPSSWRKFLELLFISLGVGFTTAGIIFFFAYNWADLHKFAKMGLMEGLIVVAILMILFSKFKPIVKNILLTGATFLVGVLFAVYGQIYQTGANAYDFFLGWTLFVTIWAIVSNFASLWLVYLVLINTTWILYSQQVAHDWSEVFVFNLLFLINSFLLIFFTIIKNFKKHINVPSWFTNIIGLASISYATLGIVFGIFENYEGSFVILILFTLAFYALGIYHSLRMKNGFYISIIPISLIIIVSALLIHVSDGEGMILFISLFIIGSVTFTIKKLISLQKKWSNE